MSKFLTTKFECDCRRGPTSLCSTWCMVATAIWYTSFSGGCLQSCVPCGVSSNLVTDCSCFSATSDFVPVVRSVAAMSGCASSVVEPKSVDAKQHEETACAPDSASAASSGSGHLPSNTDMILGSSGLLDHIQKLRAEQQTLKDDKKKLAKDMKNAMKKKKRLQTRACLLSDVDLVEVLRMRKARKGGDEQTGTEQYYMLYTVPLN